MAIETSIVVAAGAAEIRGAFPPFETDTFLSQLILARDHHFTGASTR